MRLLKLKKYCFNTVIPVILATLFVICAFFSGCMSSKDWFESTVKNYYYYDVPDEAFEGDDLKEIAKNYLDIYSAYYTKSEYESVLKSNEGSKSGIGFSYSFIEGKGIVIASVTGNSPAYISGLRVGDVLTGGIYKGSVKEFNSSNDLTGFISPLKTGEKFSLLLSDGRELTVSKEEYTASYTYLATNSTSYVYTSSADGGLALKETLSEKKTCLPDGFAYINISQFYGTAGREFFRLMEKYNALNCTSLIIDLRSNGGGYVSVMQEIAGSFAGGESKVAMISRDKQGREDRFDTVEVTNPSFRFPAGSKLYVLANSGTASASEALIGALVCYGALEYENILISDYSEEYLSWLETYGIETKTKRTYGKGIMQSTFRNSATGEALKLTTAQIYWPDGKTCIHSRGLDEEFGCRTVYAEWEFTKDDAELAKAVELICS